MGEHPYAQYRASNHFELHVAIQQNPLPTLDKACFSAEARSFVDLCLQLEPESRATAAELAEHAFFRNACSREELRQWIDATLERYKTKSSSGGSSGGGGGRSSGGGGSQSSGGSSSISPKGGGVSLGGDGGIKAVTLEGLRAEGITPVKGKRGSGSWESGAYHMPTDYPQSPTTDSRRGGGSGPLVPPPSKAGEYTRPIPGRRSRASPSPQRSRNRSGSHEHQPPAPSEVPQGMPVRQSPASHALAAARRRQGEGISRSQDEEEREGREGYGGPPAPSGADRDAYGHHSRDSGSHRSLAQPVAASHGGGGGGGHRRSGSQGGGGGGANSDSLGNSVPHHVVPPPPPANEIRPGRGSRLASWRRQNSGAAPGSPAPAGRDVPLPDDQPRYSPSGRRGGGGGGGARPPSAGQDHGEDALSAEAAQLAVALGRLQLQAQQASSQGERSMLSKQAAELQRRLERTQGM